MKYQEMLDKKIETMSMGELSQKIEKPLLSRQIKRVFENSVFYRDKFKKNGINKKYFTSGKISIHDLPFTEKAEIIEDQRTNAPFGNLLAVPADKIIRIHRTSGYSGRPVLIALTANDIKDTHEAGARMFWCAGVRPDDIVVHCLNYCLWIGGITDHLSLEAVGATVIPYGVGNTKKLLELMIQLSPTAISCTPSYLRRLEQVLAEEFRMKPNELGIKKGVFGGEAGIQDPVIRNSIEKKWDMRAIDANYGVSDVLSAFGSECDVRNGLHYHAQGIVLPELIDPVTGEKLEIKAGQTGEMVYTNLKREAQPLIRFRTRDTVEIVHVGKCPCGRSGFRFKVLGRSDDMLVVKGINVFPAAIQTVLLRYPEELNGEFEIVLSGKPPYESLSVKVEIRKDMKPCDARRLKCKIENDIKEELTVKTVIELVRENSIPREGDKVKRIRRI